MANIILAVATLIVGFIMASYGVYANVYASQRSQYVQYLDSAMSRKVDYIGDLRQDLARVPDVADVPASLFTGDVRDGIQFSYGVNAGHGYVCARAAMKDSLAEAMEKVAADRNGIYGSDCDTSGGPSGGFVSLSIRID